MPCSIMSSLPVAFHISWEGSNSFFECRIRSRDPGHADLGVILWSGRSRGPPSMSGYATEVVGRNKRRHSPRRIDTSSMWLTHSVMRIEWLLLLVCRHGSVAGSQDISNCRSAFTMPCWMFYNQRQTAWGTWNKQFSVAVWPYRLQGRMFSVRIVRVSVSFNMVTVRMYLCPYRTENNNEPHVYPTLIYVHEVSK